MPLLAACPHCQGVLITAAYQGCRVDRCERCQGAFFELGDLELAVHPLAGFPHRADRELHGVRCPKDSATMRPLRLRYGPAWVDVELCPECRGMWLDDGEPRQLEHMLKALQQDQARLEPRPPPYRSPLRWVMGLPPAAEGRMQRIPLVTLGLAALIATQLPPSLPLVTSLLLLWALGPWVEDRLGHGRFGLVCLGGALFAQLALGLAEPALPRFALGASGLLHGLLGAWLAIFPVKDMLAGPDALPLRFALLTYLCALALAQGLVSSYGVQGLADYTPLAGFVAAFLFARALATRSA